MLIGLKQQVITRDAEGVEMKPDFRFPTRSFHHRPSIRSTMLHSDHGLLSQISSPHCVEWHQYAC